MTAMRGALAAIVLVASCGQGAPADLAIPEVTGEDHRLDTWLARAPAPDDVLLSMADIGELNRAWSGSGAGTRDLTRRAWLTTAFGFLNRGEAENDPVPSLLASFGIGAAKGAFEIDLAGAKDPRERGLLLDAAAARGVLLLHDRDGAMIHVGGRHAMRRAGKQVAIRGVDLARLERITVFGPAPDVELLGSAALRPAIPIARPPETCRDREEAAVFFSPRTPHPGQPLRVIATVETSPGPVELALFAPDGTRAASTAVTVGGPPYTWIATVDAPQPGRWTALLGEDERVVTCATTRVHRKASPLRTDAAGPIWEPERGASLAVENLYAAFVERLFDYPIEDELTWPNLHTLLRDRDRNILYDHFSLDEDQAIQLRPDCADLPYTLRAYFSWKLRLPFGFFECARGSGGRPPTCASAPDHDNLTSRAALDASDEVAAFSAFANRNLRSGVHSACGRTVPEDDVTDYYPVPLRRAALKPGTLYADPYGHVIVVAAWVPQGPGRYGILLGADSQPDGTIGRRRFWRGSFLFEPGTDHAGAGFKAYRPRIMKGSGDERQIVTLTNQELKQRPEYVPYDLEQYQGSKDDFYDKMEALINPRTLDPVAVQVALVDALEESVVRRIVSVQNGIDFMNQSGWQPVDMPEASGIFLTTGPWEDYATPSRDLRLLISIDTVLQLADAVARSPGRFGLTQGAELDKAIAEVKARLGAELRGRTFTYRRSDGSDWKVSLAQVIERADGFEMAYNPNDCVEARWAAPEGSDEAKPCTQRAPDEQRRRMAEYRSWFHLRQRPSE